MMATPTHIAQTIGPRPRELELFKLVSMRQKFRAEQGAMARVVHGSREIKTLGHPCATGAHKFRSGSTTPPKLAAIEQ